MTIRGAIGTIAACTALVGGVGGGVGWALGAFVPGYYRTVFRDGREPWFDPVSAGLGLGLTQGVTGGVAVGLVVVALFVWRESRSDRWSHPAKSPDAAPGRGAGGCLVLVAALLIVVAYWAGRVHEALIAAARRQDDQIARITRFLEQSPDRYASLTFNRGPWDRFGLEGRVRTQDDLDALNEGLVRLLGEERASEILAVEVDPTPTPMRAAPAAGRDGGDAPP